MNDDVLQRVYTAVATDLYAYIRRVCRNDADADDLFQEVFTRLIGADLEGESDENIRRYTFRIATNLLRDRMRWQSRWRFDVLPERLGRAPEEQYDAGLDADRALATLKPKQRSLLWLAYVEGLPHKEIAATMGIKAKSVRVLLARARKKILQELGKDKP